MKFTKNTFIVLFLTVALMFGVVGCDDDSADSKLAAQTANAASEANAQTGYPAIKNYQEKKLVKLIYEERDKADLVCYAYFYNRNEGTLGAFIGKTIGYGVSASVQFSNPEKMEWKGTTRGWTRMPQAEPNQLFMPEGLSATYLMLINPQTGQPRPEPVYFEPLITVSPFPLHVLKDDPHGLAGLNMPPAPAVQ